MERKTILAILMVVFIAVLYPQYQRWIAKRFGSGTPQTQTVRNKKVAPTVKKEIPIKNEAAEDESAAPEKSAAVVVDSSVPSVPLQDITVETPLYKAVFTNAGMELKSFRLKKYLSEAGEWVELVPADAGGALDVYFKEYKKENSFSGTTFKVNKNNILVDKKQQNLTSSSMEMNGFTVKKNFIFYPDKYYFDLNITLASSRKNEVAEYSLCWDPGMATTEDDTAKDLQGFFSMYSMAGETDKIKFKEKTVTARGRMEWVSTQSRYFTMCMIPLSLLDSGDERGISVTGIEHKRGKNTFKQVSLKLSVPFKQGTEHTYRVFLGPKDFDILKDVGIGLEGSMDLGWPIIRPIAIVIQRFFLMMHKYISNYGIIIIIFSVLLKIVFYPLTHKSFTATKDMQKLQPLMAELKEKYKDDPQRANQETMKLYKEHGVNPLGGCLPLLLQMPVFFALFKVFDTNIEFRQAGFALWIQDLSKADPTYIMPILMGITMFLQQKLTGAGAQDERQKMMMYMMPIVMTFIFIRLSSGLILYYTVFNILSIGQQALIHYKDKQASGTPVKTVK